MGRDLLEPQSFFLVTQQPVLAGRVLREWVCTTRKSVVALWKVLDGALVANTKMGLSIVHMDYPLNTRPLWFPFSSHSIYSI